MYTYLVCGPFVQLISREISQAPSSLTFWTRDSILETRDSILETQDSILEIIEDRVSSLEARGTVNFLLSGTVCSISKLLCRAVYNWFSFFHFENWLADFASFVLCCFIHVLLNGVSSARIGNISRLALCLVLTALKLRHFQKPRARKFLGASRLLSFKIWLPAQIFWSPKIFGPSCQTILLQISAVQTVNIILPSLIAHLNHFA